LPRRTSLRSSTPLASGIEEDHIAEIDVSRSGARDFRVQVRDSGRETMHSVTVPERLLAELGVGEKDLERVVEASFRFLLEREPSTSILGEFSLDEISRYFPEYRDELARRLGPAGGTSV
jgi:hypothetical protein